MNTKTPFLTPHNKKTEKTWTSIMDKPMSMTEKNALGANIRSLNPDQLKGIISILSDSNSVEQNLKYFEFDIENLPTRKLRELEKYVKNSLNSANSNKNKKTSAPQTENEKIAQLKVGYSIKLFRLT
jgi:hypothetical protein